MSDSNGESGGTFSGNADPHINDRLDKLEEQQAKIIRMLAATMTPSQLVRSGYTLKLKTYSTALSRARTNVQGY